MRTVKILIVDDDADDIELFCDAVKEVDESIQCLSAKSGQEALDLLQKKGNGNPDFIFLDLNMPRMNGRECLARIKKDNNLASIPIIIYTTSKLNEDVEDMKQRGAVYVLTKPSRLKDLKNAISYILKSQWDFIKN